MSARARATRRPRQRDATGSSWTRQRTSSSSPSVRGRADLRGGGIASERVDASGSCRPEQPRTLLQEDEEEMIFELLVAGAFALATLRRCVYIAEFYPLSLTHIAICICICNILLRYIRVVASFRANARYPARKHSRVERAKTGRADAAPYARSHRSSRDLFAHISLPALTSPRGSPIRAHSGKSESPHATSPLAARRASFART